MQRLCRLIIALSMSGLGACVTEEVVDPMAANPRTHYTLKFGQRTPHPAPLPTETEVLVNWHYANGDTQTVPGFRGWEFGAERQFQMVEVLDETGRTTAYVFDFDGDGRVDHVVDE